MKNGGAKHEAEIVDEIVRVIGEQNGIISQDQIIEIICHFYSQLYAESTLFRKIEREIIRRNIAKPVKVNFNNKINQPQNTNQLSRLLSLYLSPNVPQDQKQPIIFQFIRNNLPKYTAPPLKRSISKELFISQAEKVRKRADSMEFPSIAYRAMMLHQFLLTTFIDKPFSLKDISDSLPVHLSAQILRSYEKRPLILSLIDPLTSNFQIELDMILPYLKMPFHALISRIDDDYHAIIPTAAISIPKFNIEREFHFLNDPSAYSDYWLYIFSLGKDKIRPFPNMIAERFDLFIGRYFKNTSVNLLPFFPYQVEFFSQNVGLTPALSSYTIQKLIKKRLNALRCPRDVFLETKLFPISGIKCFLISRSSLHPISLNFFAPLSAPFQVDGSIQSLAKLFVASRLTDQGYIVNRRSNFTLFKKQVNKWLNKCEKVSNFVSSANGNAEFSSLSSYQMALLIEEMKFPSMYIDRLENERKYIESEHKCVENETNMNDDSVTDNVEDHNDSSVPSNSNPTNYVEESHKFLQSISKLTQENEQEIPELSNLNELFSNKFPNWTEFTSNTINKNVNKIEMNQNKKENSKANNKNLNKEKSTENVEFINHVENSIESNDDSFESIIDSKVDEYPKFNYDDFNETTQNQFVQAFEFKQRLVDVGISTSVAIEFLKVVLSTDSDESTNDLKFRQVLHFSQKDAADAIFFLNSIDIYQNSGIIKYPTTNWNLKLLQKAYPDPIFIPTCENDDTPLFKIIWDIHKYQNQFDEYIDQKDSEYDEVSDDQDFEQETNQRLKKKILPGSIYRETYKGENEFDIRPNRFEFPLLPSITLPFDFSSSYNFFNNVYDVDPLSQFCFGQYELSIPYLKDFPSRFIMNVIYSGGVYGISLSDIVHSCGEVELTCDSVIESIQLLSSMNFICRVPSSQIVPSYSCYIPCNTICRPVNEKLDLVPCHIWTSFDGTMNEKVKMDLINNLSSFVFSHEFCDFEDIMTQFPYVSPYDLCLILQLLECDEILFSQYYQIDSSDLFEDSNETPIPPFSSFEKFLLILDRQRKENLNPKFSRKIRTNRSMFPNLCALNNL